MPLSTGTTTGTTTTTTFTTTTTTTPAPKQQRSLWQQWSQDATHAFQDLYGSWILGDDAGQSAKLVVVVNGTGSAAESSMIVDAAMASGGAGAGGAGAGAGNDPGNSSSATTAGTSSSSFGMNGTNYHTNNGNASSNNNASPHKVMSSSGQHPGGGGGGGGGTTLNNNHGNNTSLASLGVTFCEINGRAYVQTVERKSRAEAAGVCPRDCVQYAAVLAQEWNDPLGEDFAEIRKHALEREESGQRITYKELKALLQTGVLTNMLDQQQQQQQQQLATAGCLAPRSVPTTIQVGALTNNPCGSLGRKNSRGSSNSSLIQDLPPPNHHGKNNTMDHARPVVLVFRRTKQRPMTSLPIWPNYRLDDECDVACQILQSLAAASSSSSSSSSPNSSSMSSSYNNNNNNNKQFPSSTTTSETTTTNVKRGGGGGGGGGKGNNHSSDAASVNSASMSTTNTQGEEEETVEAATIRAMIQNAVGLAFLRSNKVVLGVSIHAGSGIVIARLPDGTWSAPSAIGIAGIGLGFQLGVEVAHSILILQTKEALEHFQRGGSFTVGANVGAAVGGVGREAIGAASLSGVFCGTNSSMDQVVMVKDDEYHAETNDPSSSSYYYGGAQSSVGVAPLVAYAKSQGLYVGLSLEGSRIHGRNDVNARTYQFETRKSITAHDLLTGKVAPPPEADKLYEALHQVEFTHELQSLPRPPKALWGRKAWYASTEPILFLGGGGGGGIGENNNSEDQASIQEFERKFREFLFGGVYVWRVRGRKRERRTLWLYVPEGSASLQLGFVSKLSNVETNRTGSSTTEMGDDRRSVASEEVTLDSALMDNQSVLNHSQGIRTQVELSRKNSVALTDVICMNQTIPSDLILEKPEESRRVISLETNYNQLSFVAKSDNEAQVLMSGIKILLEAETKRCGVRGGIGRDGESPRNSNASSSNGKRGGKKNKKNGLSGYASSEVEDNDDMSAISIGDMPEGWKSWGRVPGRNFLRGQAAANDHGYPQYVHGQLLVRDIAKNVHLPLPLPLCRVLLLDSSSPVISQWEKDRGDLEFEKTPWTFPPATPRERDQYQSEHQLIASGSMCGAHRTISYQRPRLGQLVRLFETQIVDSDDSEKLAFQIYERMPRRGFSIKVKILLRSYNSECEATVLGEIRPVGKNMSNPEAVHKAFLLVVDELRERYGPEGKGLLSGFLNAVNTFKEEDLPPHMNRSFQKFGEEKKEQDSSSSVSTHNDGKSIKLEDMLKANANLMSDVSEPNSLQDRTPSPMDAKKYRESYRKPKPAPMPSDTFDAPASEPVMIEVKPLPKIRLSLMPSPREEDEFDLEDDSRQSIGSSTGSGAGSKPKRSNKKSWGKKRKPRKANI